MWDCVKINYGVCVHGEGGTCHPVQQCDSLILFLLVYGQQWSSMAQSNKLWIDRLYMIVDQFIVGFGVFMVFDKKNRSGQPFPFKPHTPLHAINA